MTRNLSHHTERDLITMLDSGAVSTRDFMQEMAKRKLPPIDELLDNTAPSKEVVAAGFSDGNAVKTETGWPQPSAFIQWKGTEVCMDFHCECGKGGHFDGDFAYAVKCQHCGTVWEMPSVVYPRKIAPTHIWANDPRLIEKDDDA